MRNSVFIALAGIFILVNSCEENSNDPGYNRLCKKWILTGFQYQDSLSIETPPENIPQMNIEFEKSGAMNAISSCNVFQGSYFLYDTDSIKIEDLISTLKLCMGEEVMDWELIYFQGLKNAVQYLIEENKLTIRASTNYNLYFIKDE
ncbi:MAG: META domain-containing protein [Bacteroidales bacterium]|nr:MAG: META domain-containing protein [Bacteroidales bacterium]